MYYMCLLWTSLPRHKPYKHDNNDNDNDNSIIYDIINNKTMKMTI